MASSLVVPVIDVEDRNFKELWPAMVVAIKTASFIALDTELSGLGNRKSLLAESIEDRYKAICHAARSRSILSLGIACYKKLDNKAADTYLIQVYNLTLLCAEEYVIEPQSVQFLVRHGFDFNKQNGHGISYFKGNNKGKDDSGVHIRALFTELLRAKKPLVLHNGLIDMVFLYQSFYAHLPERLAAFTADLSEMFPAGIYDTKYITEFELRLAASYLEYAYKKCKLDNSRSLTSGLSGPHVLIEFCQYSGHMSTYVDYIECPDVTSSEGQTDICPRFSAFGWCSSGAQCPLSHDTDSIVLHDEKRKEDKKQRRKRQKEKNRGRGGDMTEGSSIFDGAPLNKKAFMEVEPDEMHSDQQAAAAEDKRCKDIAVTDGERNTQTDQNHGEESKTEGGREELREDSAETVTQKNKPVDAGLHRAGFDAFMTGYIFACSCTVIKKTEADELEDKEGQQPPLLPTCLNKLYLSGKAAPLNIVKSVFTKSSKAHIQKMEMVWGKSL
ncbi:target of EGR1 protein 1 [Pholidichthys leucotaenia]